MTTYNTFEAAQDWRRLPWREQTRFGQTFWPGAAYREFPAGCMCDRSGSCEWCDVYYHGPESERERTR